ncbi:IclR family transcriptional regulator [Nocardiopsis sediminis]|uniref:IclR family transcriptional regulator n=1 Tax=Nocardiopsis sediminis TaxID=1778267 RepID=A0ABV8FIR4_9ACTN
MGSDAGISGTAEARARRPVQEKQERSGEVQSVARAGQLLNRVVDAPAGLTLTELAGTTALNISTVHRLLRTLCSQGLLCRDPVSERFLPGPVLLRLARRSLVSAGLPEVTDALRALVERTGETATIGVRQGGDVVVGLAVSSPDPFRYNAVQGSRTGLLRSALGLAILAFDRTPLENVAHSAADHTELLSVQFRGYAVLDAPDTAGLRAVAVPLLADGAPVTMAVEVQGPAARISDDRLDDVADAVRAAAHRLQDLPVSLLLGEV